MIDLSNLLKITNYFQSKIFVNLSCYFVILLPSVRFFFKYLSFQPILCFCFYASIVHIIKKFLINNEISKPFKDFFSKPFIITLIFISTLVIVSYLYPIADGLKDQMRGSDQDDCVILGVNFLSRLKNPYSEYSYFGNPCSTGLGIIILYFPFVISGFYQLGTISSVILSIFSVEIFTKEKYRAFIFSFIISSSLIFLELIVVGSDLIFIGAGIVFIVYYLTDLLKTKNISKLIVLSIFTGLIASSRINFLVLIPLLTLFIFSNWERGALLFLTVSMSIAIIPSAFIYFSDPQQFMPLHLLGKSNLFLKYGLKECAIFMTILMIVISCKLCFKKSENIPLSLFLSLSPSLICLSFGDLIFENSFNFATWEGANYLVPIIPLAAALMSENLHPTNNPKKLRII